MTLYAHTDSEHSADRSRWQTLADHLNNVADRAECFASAFGMGSYGRVLGLLHDVGKASDLFQARLAGSSERVDHATAGACEAVKRYGPAGQLLAYSLAGHHGGLPNGIPRTHGLRSEGRTPLQDRLEGDIEPYDGFFDLVESGELVLPAAEDLGHVEWPSVPSRRFPSKNLEADAYFSVYVLDRMLYSCLTDADYLDTERFMSPNVYGAREGRRLASIAELDERLDAFLAGKRSADTPVNAARQDVLTDCVVASQLDQGLFTLTVPTGGGKTLSSLAFALKHARKHDLDRVIVAIPFTSITSQTAQVLRDILGAENVLEHHSNVDFGKLDDEEALSYKLASQNWDAPVVVTTNVQLFESLFASKPGKSRKIHRIAKSVVVLDEAQTLPDPLLLPTLAMLEELTLAYRTTVVLCTATQPVLDDLWPFGSEPAEIVKHREKFQEAFGGRVEYDVMGGVEADSLIEGLCKHDQVLCIVGTKGGARLVYDRLAERLAAEGEIDSAKTAFEKGVFHLSAFMMPVHRSDMIERIRMRLQNGERCMVVSTQLIEAGVDVDFPVVYRELAGMDSIVQAAGRCNREGKRAAGIVHVFELFQDGELKKTSKWLENMKHFSRELIQQNGGRIDETLISKFFDRRYCSEELDAMEIFKTLSARSIRGNKLINIPFEQCACDYKIIDDATTAVLIPFESGGRQALHDLMQAEYPVSLTSRMQQYSVSVPTWLVGEYERAGVVDKRFDPLVFMKEYQVAYYYREDVGLIKPGEEEPQFLAL